MGTNDEDITSGTWELNDSWNPDMFLFRGEKCLSAFGNSGRTMYIRKVGDGFFALYEKVNNQ